MVISQKTAKAFEEKKPLPCGMSQDKVRNEDVNGKGGSYCIQVPYCLVTTTLFPLPLPLDRTQKHCFLYLSVWSDARNSVSSIFPSGVMQETLFPASSRLEECKKRCFQHLPVWRNARNSVSGIFRQGMELLSCYKPFAQIFLTVQTLFLTTVSVELTYCRSFTADESRAYRQKQGQELDN